jgi:alanyl-tRNA synthetase
MAEAQAMGAIAFFGEKYGDVVRVLEAGEESVELCGGTHVHALGFIGPVKIVSEGSIGSNLRRIEAVTGAAALEHIREEEATLRRLSEMLRAGPAEVPEKVERLVEQVRALNDEIQRLRTKEAVASAAGLAATAEGGVVVVRRDGLTADDLRRLAQETARALGSGVVALVGVGADGGKAGIAVAVTPDLVARGASAAEIAAHAARALGGGTAKHAELVVGGGPNTGAIDEALAAVRDQAVAWRQ